jgi:two-component system cell cycle sensor histidine kinase/response regulator CckA
MAKEMDLDKNGNTKSRLRDVAEEKLSKLRDATQNLKDKTPEEIIHELHVHEIELEMQNEELKRVQLELEESRDKYRDKYKELYDFAPVGYFTLTHKGLIAEVNLTGEALLGMPRLKLIKRGFGHFVTSESLDQWDHHIIAVLRNEEAQTCDLRLKREDGSLFYAHLSSIRVDEPAELEQTSVHVIATAISDISERKQAEQALKDSEERQRSLVEHLPQRIFIKDRNSIYMSCNKNYASDLGIAPDQIVGKDDFAFYPPELAQAYRADDQACMATGMVKDIDEEPYKADGQELWIHTIKVPYHDTQGRVIGVLGIFEDITARKRLETERLEMERTLLHAQKLKSLGIMAGRISHDFSNQLAVVLGNLELALADLPPDSEATESIVKAIEAANSSVELSLQMLIYSGSAFYLPQDIHLNELLNQTIDLLKFSVPKHGHLKLELGDKLPPIKGDTDQIQRLITNILGNAVEAIGDEEGQIRLSTGVLDCDESYLRHNRLEMKPEPGRFVFLEITDTGCGMSAETLRKLFDPFFTTKSNSRGLGMSEVMGIAKGHHGALFVISQLGKGTTVQVVFPVSKESQASSLTDSESVETKSSEPGALNRRKTVLLVDDEKAVRDFTVRRLNGLGYDTITAADGEQGVRTFRERLNDIDLVILDFAMPRMNGVEAFDELIRITPDVKVILCSGYAQDEVIKSFPRRHDAAVLHKPYTIEDLKAELERLL